MALKQIAGSNFNTNSGDGLYKLADLLGSFQKEALAREKLKLENTRYEDSINYRDNAPQRAEDARLLSLDQGAERAKFLKDASFGISHTGANRIPELLSSLNNDPRYASLSDETGASRAQALGLSPGDPRYEQVVMDAAKDKSTKAGYQNQFILENNNKMTRPKEFKDQLEASMIQSKLFSPEQIEAEVNKQVATRYPTASKEFIESQMLDPNKIFGKTGGNTVNNFGTGGSSSSSGKVDFVSGQNSQAQKMKAQEEYLASIGVDEVNDDSWWESGRQFLGLDPKVTKQNFTQAVDKIVDTGTSRSAAMVMVGSLVDKHTESKFDLNNLSPEDIKNIKLSWSGIQNEQEKLLNNKTGQISYPGQAGGSSSLFGPGGAANLAAIKDYNAQIASQGVPSAFSDAQLREGFLAGLGEAPAPAPTGGGKILTPPVIKGKQNPAGGTITDTGAVTTEEGNPGNLQALLDGIGADETNTESVAPDNILAPNRVNLNSYSPFDGLLDGAESTANSFEIPKQQFEGGPGTPEQRNTGAIIAPRYDRELGKLFKKLDDPETSMYGRGLSSYMRDQLLSKGKAALASGEISLEGKSGTRNDKIVQAMLEKERQTK